MFDEVPGTPARVAVPTEYVIINIQCSKGYSKVANIRVSCLCEDSPKKLNQPYRVLWRPDFLGVYATENGQSEIEAVLKGPLEGTLAKLYITFFKSTYTT